MALYQYTKEYFSLKKKLAAYFAYFLLMVGALLLFWSFYPIVSFEFYSRFLSADRFLSPLPKSQSVVTLAKTNSILGNYNNALSSNLRDFTKANLWFPKKPQTGGKGKLTISSYLLSIPKLDIDKAKVVVGGEDLSKSLVHYLPLTAPGQLGTLNIFGHSSLPQLYKKGNYKTIFTYLPSLEKGDKIYIYVKENGAEIKYEYQIINMFIVDPDEVSVLEPKTDASYLSLITCVPPGTFWKRLVVEAKLTKLPTGENFQPRGLK